MAGDDPLSPEGDPFGPPETPTEVGCIHCGQTYMSDLIEWQIVEYADKPPHGFWCCPIEGCGGMGFGFDILPTDRTYRDERGGWIYDDDSDESDDEFDDFDDSEIDSHVDEEKRRPDGVDDIPF